MKQWANVQKLMPLQDTVYVLVYRNDCLFRLEMIVIWASIY